MLLAIVVALFLLGTQVAQAQGLTLVEADSALANIDIRAIGLFSLRIILAVALGVSGIVGFFNAYLWLTHEGNMLKAHNRRKTLAKALLVATIAFAGMSVLHIFVPDYTTLTL